MGPSKLMMPRDSVPAVHTPQRGGTSGGVTVAPNSGKASGAGWRLGRTEQVRVSGSVWEVAVAEPSSVLSPQPRGSFLAAAVKDGGGMQCP